MPKITPRDTLCTDIPRVGSDCTGPLNTLQTDFGSWMGFRMTPCDLSELICCKIQYVPTLIEPITSDIGLFRPVRFALPGCVDGWAAIP